MRIFCNVCSKLVSTEIPEGAVIRAWVECPECASKKDKYTLFNAIAPYNRIFVSQDFISNGFLAIRMKYSNFNHNGFDKLVSHLWNNNWGEPAYCIGQLRPFMRFPRSICFAPVRIHPPYDDVNQIYVVNADFLELITGDDWEDFTFRCGKIDDYETPIVSIYSRGQLWGFVAVLHISDNESEQILIDLKTLTTETANAR